MKLRTKILSGFIILAIMLAAAGALSIHELLSIGSSVNRLLEENYKSINAARIMTEALESEDSGILLLLSGKWQEGSDMIESADLSFRRGFEIAQKNVTIANERQYVSRIEAGYRAYKQIWVEALADAKKERDLDWYFAGPHTAFLTAKQSIEELLVLNDETMYQTASSLHNRAGRAIMPGIVAIVSSLLFVLIFNYFINYYVIKPINLLTREVRNKTKARQALDINIETNDEIHELAAAIKELALARQRSL